MKLNSSGSASGASGCFRLRRAIRSCERQTHYTIRTRSSSDNSSSCAWHSWSACPLRDQAADVYRCLGPAKRADEGDGIPLSGPGIRRRRSVPEAYRGGRHAEQGDGNPSGVGGGHRVRRSSALRTEDSRPASPSDRRSERWEGPEPCREPSSNRDANRRARFLRRHLRRGELSRSVRSNSRRGTLGRICRNANATRRRSPEPRKATQLRHYRP